MDAECCTRAFRPAAARARFRASRRENQDRPSAPSSRRPRRMIPPRSWTSRCRTRARSEFPAAREASSARANSIILADKSAPVMRAPRRAKILVLLPSPHPASSTVLPLRSPTNSRNAGLFQCTRKMSQFVANLVGPYVGIAIPLRGNFGLTNLRRHFFPPARSRARLKKMRTRKISSAEKPCCGG